MNNLSFPSRSPNLFFRISLISNFYALSHWQGSLELQADGRPTSFFSKNLLYVACRVRHQTFAHDSNVGFECLRNYAPLHNGNS